MSLAQVTAPIGIDPDSIDTEMTQVMYLISPNDIRANTYKNGYPSVFSITLCKTCQQKSYTLKDGADLLLNEQPLDLSDLTITLIKKKFDVIQLGIDRSDRSITYLYLGGLSEFSAKVQEQ
jgi:hypothetical protein